MKKVFLILCLFGIILPYYQLILFILGGGAFEQFWTEAFASHPSSMLAMDLSVAALAFFIFLIFERVQKRIKRQQFIKYVVCLFLVCFSLALPVYLYDTFDQQHIMMS